MDDQLLESKLLFHAVYSVVQQCLDLAKGRLVQRRIRLPQCKLLFPMDLCTSQHAPSARTVLTRHSCFIYNTRYLYKQFSIQSKRYQAFAEHDEQRRLAGSGSR